MTPAQSFARCFLLLCLALLLAAGIYHRLAHPSLTRRTDMPAAEARNHDHPPLADADKDRLAAMMAALRKNPSDVEQLLSVADLFGRGGDWANAEMFLDRAAEAAPADMRPHYFRGLARASRKDYAAAAEAFEKALALAPGNDSAKFNLGVLYQYHLNQHTKADALFAEVAASPAASETLRSRARDELGRK